MGERYLGMNGEHCKLSNEKSASGSPTEIFGTTIAAEQSECGVVQRSVF
jgi:hypothetical protein